MNSLQIDYLNALTNQRKAEAEIALNEARVGETRRKSDYIFEQTSGQRLGNREYSARLQNLDRQVKNQQYRLDMDNAMLWNTVDWWVNGGKKLSDASNRRWNPYWNTSGNMPREFQGVVNGIKDVISIPMQLLSPLVKLKELDMKYGLSNYNLPSKGFIN